MAEPQESDAVAGRRLGDFTLLRRLGKGSQGEVYEARQESLGRLVALKLLSNRLAFNEDGLQRFRREAEAGGRLNHVGLVTVHAVGTTDGVHWIAQELVPGGRTLADLFDEARRLPELPRDWPTRMAELFARVAEALHAAHEAGVVHRDVKPFNILLSEDGQPKVADFGLALVQDELSLSHTGDLAGTPFYMSPEQVRGERSALDRRTDVFSLGATLYEALTLSRPFAGDRERLLAAIVQDDPPDPRRLNPHVPRDLSVICLHAIEKLPARRYATAGALAADLRRHLDGDAILARPPRLPTRAAKWARRHPGTSAASLVGLLALGVVTWLWIDTRADKRLAEQARERLAEAWEAERRAGEATVAALAQAEAERLRAAAESRTARDVVAMLEEVLGNVDPLHPGAGELLQPAEVLDRGAQVVASLSAQPVVRWQLLARIGRGYRNLGLLAPAEEQLAAAHGIAQQAFGAQDEHTVFSALELARVHRLRREFASADALASGALAALSARGVEPDLLSLAVVGELGLLRAAEGRVAEAERHLRDYLAGCERLAPDRRPTEHVVLARQSLGQFLLDRDRLDEAAPLLESAFAAAVLLPEYDRLQLQHAVALLDDRLGRRATALRQLDKARALDLEAERLFRLALERQRQLLGPAHLDTLTTMHNFGDFYRQRGRDDMARPLLEQALALLLQRGPDAEPAALYARNGLALLEHSVGRIELAEQHWRAIVAGDRDRPAADARPVLAALSSLASLARDDGRLGEAQALAAELVARTPADAPEAGARRAKLAGIEAALRASEAGPGAP